MSLIDLTDGQMKVVSSFYQVLKRLGEGRFAEVYLAYDTSSSNDVALKIYRQADARARELAQTEARTLQTLKRHNSEFFPVLRKSLKYFIRNQHHPVLAMELGRYTAAGALPVTVSLNDILPAASAKPKVLVELPEFWEADSVRRWAVDLATAVRLLHESAVIHRDIKPANVLLKRAPSAERAIPLLLDFNTARGGTPRYLPPEVNSGRRKEPVAADDLWGLAQTLWDLFFGDGAEVGPAAKPHVKAPPLPPAAAAFLLRALSPRTEDRPETAAAFLSELEMVLLVGSPVTVTTGAISTDEWLAAKGQTEHIREAIIDDLAGPEELLVPKELRELVQMLFSWLSQQDTQSLDLTSDLLALGPRAIPAVLQEAYKIDSRDPAFAEVVAALTQLAALDRDRALRSLSFYSLSSNLGVRRMCREVCRSSRLFPVTLREALVTDEQILLPAERVELADLCLQLDDDRAEAVLTLTKYICREYVLDSNRYRDLRDRVASRLGTLAFPDTARLISEDVAARIWEDLPEFESLSSDQRVEKEKGLIQLLAEGFARMGDAALTLLRTDRVPRRLDGPTRPFVFRVFAKKLAHHHVPAKAWLEAQAKANPADLDLAFSIDTPQEPERALEEVLSSYLEDGSNRDLNTLRFGRDKQLFELLRGHLQGEPPQAYVERIALLLKGCESRMRPAVVSLACDSWDRLFSVAPDTMLATLREYRIEDRELRNRVIALLERQRAGPHKQNVKDALDRILES
jgi:serine/threonine protein kinase